MSGMHLSRVAWLVVSIWLLPALPVLAQPGLAQRLAALEAQVAALRQQVTALSHTSTTIDVHCETGDSLQAALNDVRFRPNQVIVNVFGVCHENVAITHAQLLIGGAAPGAGIQAADPSQPVVLNVDPWLGSGHLRLSALTISGGGIGVFADNGTQVQISDCTIANNGTGVVVDHSAMARVVNTTIDGGGISVAHGAQVFMSGGVVQNSVGNGVSLFDGAAAHFTGGALITANHGDGITAHSGSVISFGPATASANGSLEGLWAGIAARGGSSVFLWGGAVIDNNRGNGVMLSDTSVVQKIRVERNIKVTNNRSWGISCSPSPAVAQLVGFNVSEGDLSGNESGTHNCPKTPAPPSQ